MEEKIDRQPPERLEDEVSSLTANEQATAAQLRLMDPQLAGLYERGLRLMSQIHQPENVYLLAHCGRELSNGVLQLLLDEGGARSFCPGNGNGASAAYRSRARFAPTLIRAWMRGIRSTAISPNPLTGGAPVHQQTLCSEHSGASAACSTASPHPTSPPRGNWTHCLRPNGQRLSMQGSYTTSNSVLASGTTSSDTLRTRRGWSLSQAQVSSATRRSGR